MPSSRATYAIALPWLPAEHVTTPRARSASVRRVIVKKAPRILKEPVSWSDSSLRETGTPAISESRGEASIGVRRTRPSITRRASRTSGIVSAVTASLYPEDAGDLARTRSARRGASASVRPATGTGGRTVTLALVA